jgi:hypothetical protein
LDKTALAFGKDLCLRIAIIANDGRNVVLEQKRDRRADLWPTRNSPKLAVATRSLLILISRICRVLSHESHSIYIREGFCGISPDRIRENNFPKKCVAFFYL